MKKAIYIIFVWVPFYFFAQDSIQVKNKVVAIDDFKDIVEKALEDSSKTKIGTFKLKNGKTINIKKKHDDSIIIIGKLEVISVKIDIYEGNIYDIRVNGENDEEKEIIFTNKRPFALSDANKAAIEWKLYDIENNKWIINLKELLEYDYRIGKNYIIDKDTISLNEDNKFTKEIHVENNLKNLIDFRIYSDFLGILNEEANGIVNFEANSTFYLFPKPFRFNSRDQGFTFLSKKVKTHVNYSRFDNDDRALNITDLNLDDEDDQPDQLLDLVQRSFLTVGGELDVWEYQPYKFAPITFYGKARINLFVTETETTNAENAEEEPNRENTTTLSWGLGIGVISKRYSNFGVSASAFWDRYQNNNLNNEGALNFNTLSFNSEAFFYTGTDSDNAIFLRLNYTQGQNGISSSANFFSIQFGYRAELKINRNNN